MSLAAQLADPVAPPVAIVFNGQEIFLKEDWFWIVKANVVDRPPTEEEIEVTIKVFGLTDTLYFTAEELAIKSFGNYRYSALLKNGGGRSVATCGRKGHTHKDGCR